MPRRAASVSRTEVRAALDRMLAHPDVSWKHPAIRDLSEKVPNLRAIYAKRHATRDEQWAKIRDCAHTLGVTLEYADICNETLNPSHPLIGRSFADNFDPDLNRASRTIEDYNGLYLHFSLTLDGLKVGVGVCDLKRQTWEGKLPAYEFWRQDGKERHIFHGAYFRNDTKLFLIGSQNKKSDARLHIFKIGENILESGEGESLFEGLMTGVSPWGEPFSSRVCMKKASEMELAQYANHLGAYTFEQLAGEFPDVCAYLSQNLTSKRPVMMIDVRGMDIM